MAYDDIAGRPVSTPAPVRRDSHAQHMHAPAKRPARLGVTSSSLAAAPDIFARAKRRRRRPPAPPLSFDFPTYRPMLSHTGPPEGMPTQGYDAEMLEQVLALRDYLMSMDRAPRATGYGN